MVLSITPDYELMLRIIFAIWILETGFYIITGIARCKIPIPPERYGIIELVTGVVNGILVLWVIFR